MIAKRMRRTAGNVAWLLRLSGRTCVWFVLPMLTAVGQEADGHRQPAVPPLDKILATLRPEHPRVMATSRTGLPDPLVMKPEDWKAFLDFADKRLGSPAKPHAAPRSVALLGTPSSDAVDRQAPHGLEYQAVPHRATSDPAAAPGEVPRWELHEFELHGPCRAENPFRDGALAGEFTAPSGKTTIAEGFYDGDDTWRLRFAPNEEGQRRYRLHGEGVEIRQEGRLKCVAPGGHGFIGIHPQKQVHHTDTVRRTSWRIVCAGGYFAAGFHGTIGHSDAWNRIDAPNRYTFTVRDEGAARRARVFALGRRPS